MKIKYIILYNHKIYKKTKFESKRKNISNKSIKCKKISKIY